VKVKHKGKSTPNPPKALPSKPSELRGWPVIAKFLYAEFHCSPLGERRNARSSQRSKYSCAQEKLNQWLQRISGEAAGVHVVIPVPIS
jgi:hypothetical protein